MLRAAADAALRGRRFAAAVVVSPLLPSSAPAVIAASSGRATNAAPRRYMGAMKFPLQPYSKTAIKARREFSESLLCPLEAGRGITTGHRLTAATHIENSTHCLLTKSASFAFLLSAGPRFIRNWLSYNDPLLLPKFLRHAERVARETGVADELRAFDTAAAAFPNKPKIVAAT